MPEIYKIGGVHVKAIDVLSFEYQRRAAKRREEEERHFYRIAKPKDDQRCYGADELARRLGVKERAHAPLPPICANVASACWALTDFVQRNRISVRR